MSTASFTLCCSFCTMSLKQYDTYIEIQDDIFLVIWFTLTQIPVISADTGIYITYWLLNLTSPYCFLSCSSDASRLWEPPVCPLQLVHVRCHDADLQTLGFPYHWAQRGHWETVLQQLPWCVGPGNSPQQEIFIFIIPHRNCGLFVKIVRNDFRSSFSSGFLVSLDDFYLLGSGLMMTQTTNNVFNSSLFDTITPNSLLAWQRVRLAHSLAHNGEEWAETFSMYNSGEWLYICKALVTVTTYFTSSHTKKHTRMT